MVRTSANQPVEVVLVAALKECPKCLACEEMIGRLQAQHPGAIVLRKVRADDPEAESYGVVMPPMLIVGDFIACAGKVPIESALDKLITNELEKTAP